MKSIPTLFVFILFFLLSACQTEAHACPPESITYISNPSSLQNLRSNDSTKPSADTIEINGQEMQVDQVIRGTLCNGSWKGTIYVPCEIQIYEWEEDPTFLKNCDLTIEPGTVVYVAAHNEEPYYQGCSCHFGE